MQTHFERRAQCNGCLMTTALILPQYGDRDAARRDWLIARERIRSFFFDRERNGEPRSRWPIPLGRESPQRRRGRRRSQGSKQLPE